MDTYDKDLVRDSVKISGSAILATIDPSLLVAWEFCFSVLGTVIDRRRDRAYEWLNLFSENKESFSSLVTKTQSFQDAFTNSFESFIKERNEEKRKIMKSIFLDFSVSSDIEAYPLERYYSILNILSTNNLHFLKTSKGKINDKAFSEVDVDLGLDQQKILESLSELITSGILITDPNPKWGPVAIPSIKFSVFGLKFIQFLEE